MSPLHAALALIRPYVERGETTTQLAKSRLTDSGPDYTAGIGPSAGSVDCPGQPGFITISALNGEAVCHRFGLHQMHALIKNGYPRDSVQPQTTPAPKPAPEPAVSTDAKQIGLF